MEEFWARIIKPSGQPGPNYWTYFAERLAHLATIPKGATILDIGTYDGNVLFKAMKGMGAQGYGVGVDIYYGGFQDGVDEANQRGWQDRIAFVHTDANTLGFLPDVFHCVLSNFMGWDDCYDFERMEFIGPNKIMLEIMRVLKPGGQVGIGSWVAQSDIDWITEAFKKYLPGYEKKNGKSISCYAEENPEGQKAILESSGFNDIRVQVETMNVVSPDAETWWRQMQQAANRTFKQVSDPIKLERFKEQVLVDLQSFEHPDGIRFSKTVSFAFGTKPL